jgi:hypothetical protein
MAIRMLTSTSGAIDRSKAIHGSQLLATVTICPSAALTLGE